MFICEPHHDKWNKDTGCSYCREDKLAAENKALTDKNEILKEWLKEADASDKALREAAMDYIEGNHFPDCKALRVDLKNPRCNCGHDELAKLLEKI